MEEADKEKLSEFLRQFSGCPATTLHEAVNQCQLTGLIRVCVPTCIGQMFFACSTMTVRT